MATATLLLRACRRLAVNDDDLILLAEIPWSQLTGGGTLTRALDLEYRGQVVFRALLTVNPTN